MPDGPRLPAGAQGTQWFSHAVGGLNILSPLRLPALPAGDGPADLTIRIVRTGAPPDIQGEATRGPNWAVGGDAWLVQPPLGGRLHLRAGRALTVWGRTAAQIDEALDFIPGAALSAALLYRDRLPLHAGAVSVGERAILVHGASGRGKSTLLAALMKAGGVVVADDLCAPEPGPDGPVLRPVFPALRLLPDAADALALRGAPTADGKVRLPIPAGLSPEPVRIGAVVLLTGRQPGSGSIKRLPPALAVPMLLSHVTGLSVAPLLGSRRDLLASVADLCAAVPVFSVSAPDGLDRLPGFAAHLAAMAGGAAPCP
ncbi:hypothetical protein [Oleisolibacter albus]|uniref:hypothetical protein n=1 Tax=Oleisolibacter albus TaxID=2171757 RepID=UPI000DF20E19|nr:hypothetical protein [Oleisolibacter albus]